MISSRTVANCAHFFFVYLPAVLLIAVLFPLTSYALSEADAARQAALQAQLTQVEADIAKNTSLLQSKQKETASLQRDLDVLTYQISMAKLKIQEKQLQIQRLGTSIGEKVQTIGTLNSKIDTGKASLAELLRQVREYDDTSAVEVAFQNDNLSDVFSDLSSFDSIQGALDESFNTIVATKTKTETQKSSLEVQRDAATDAKAAIEAETKKIQTLEAQKQTLIKASKNQESGYETIIADRKQKRTQILSALFALRDTGSISFEQALTYAKEASARTGVRPAFILAILTQETNLGQNVGKCNLPGQSADKLWSAIMKPTRDIDPYLRITKSLGIAPDAMPLSCPQGNGWGGAMGPSQFIPSTWELYESRIATVTGNNPPDPWKAEDAFAATSLYLEDLGAAAGTYTAEYRAAGKYYAGSNWATAGASYASSVLAIAERIQNNIDYLSNN